MGETVEMEEDEILKVENKFN